jgi:hypothetical protein
MNAYCDREDRSLVLRGARGMWIDDVSGQVLDWNVRMGAGEPTAGIRVIPVPGLQRQLVFPFVYRQRARHRIGAAVPVIGEGGAP